MSSFHLFSFLLATLLISCVPSPHPSARLIGTASVNEPPGPTPAPSASPLFGPPAPSGTPVPKTPRHPLEVRSSSRNGINVTAVIFDRRDYFLKVVDQMEGPGSQFDSAEAAARSENGIAAINGGFFSPEGKPVGLVITNGESRGSYNSTSFLGTGILDGGKVKLATRQNYQRSSELLQSGPRLVWQGETLTGLSATNPRPRSFLIWNGREHFGLVHADSASLKDLSETLKSQPIPGFTIQYAVNLDGGTSCDLWVASSVSGGGFTRSPFFRKKARNYLVLRAR